MVEMRVRMPRKEPQQKFLGYVEFAYLPVKVDDRVTIPKGTKMIRPNGNTFVCPSDMIGKVVKVTQGKSYKDWNKDCTTFNVVNVENPMLGFNTSLGVLMVDINDVVLDKPTTNQ